MTRILPAAVLVVLVQWSGAALAQAPPPGVAPDREMIEVRLREGDTCEIVAERLYGHRRYYFVVAEHLPGLDSIIRTACDRALMPGEVVRLPRRAVPEGSGADARVTSVKRHVRSRATRDEAWRQARVGQELSRGARVSTLARSAAELTFSDTSRLHLRERTLVVIYGATSRAARRRSTKAVLERGTLRSRLGELAGDASLRVDTPTARAELRAGEAVVSVDPEETSHVANHRGSAATVSAPDGRGRVKVHAGMGTRVRRGKLPTRPRPLPSAPSWRGEGPTFFVGLERRGATVRAGWSTRDGAESFVVEILADGGGGGPAETRRVPGLVRRLEVRGLPAGLYAARVAAVDGEGFESRPSAPLGLSVTELALVPPLAAEEPEEGSPTAPRLLAGTLAVSPRGVLCTAGRGDPTDRLVLVEPGSTQIRCHDGDGRQAPPLEVEVLEVRARFAELDEGAAVELVRGEPALDLAVVVEADQALPTGLEVEAGPGLEAHIRGGSSGTGRVELEAGAVEDAPPETHLDLIVSTDHGRALLARLPVTTVAPEPPEPVEEPGGGSPGDDEGEEETAWLDGPGVPHEGSSLLLQRGTFGVRDERRPGTGAWIAMAWIGDRRGDEGSDQRSDELFSSGGVRASFLDERLRFDLGVHVNNDDLPGGGWVAASSRLLATEVVGLAVEVGAWVPFGDEEGAGHSRLLPSVDASFRVGSRVTLRTRQGGLFDLAEDGARLWSSAYAVDVWAIGPLSAGAEAIVIAGVDDGRTVVAPAASLGVSLRFHIVTATVAARYAFTDDGADLLGQVVVVGAVRVAAGQ